MIYVLIGIAVVLIVIVLFSSAPDGYEDENGFHFGKKE